MRKSGGKRRSFLWLPLLLVLLVAIVTVAFLIRDIAGGGSKSGGADLAPDITVTDLNGNKVKLSQYRGKTVLLNFRTTWCGYCRAEAPELQKAHEAISNLVIFSVNIQETAASVTSYMQELNLTFPMYVDADGTAAQKYDVRGIPSSFFIDEKGKIFAKSVGPLTLDSIRSYLQQK